MLCIDNKSLSEGQGMRTSYNLHYRQSHLPKQYQQIRQRSYQIPSLKHHMISHTLSPLCTQIQLYRFASILAFRHLKNNTEYIYALHFLKLLTGNNNLSAKMRRDSSEFQSKNPMHHLILLKAMLMANFTYHLKHISAFGYQNQIKNMLLTLHWQSWDALCLNSSALRLSLPKVQYRIYAVAKFSICYWNYSTKKYE